MKWIVAFFGGLALLAAAVICAGAQTPPPGPPGLVPLNLSMEKLQFDTLKCKAFEAEANFHAYNAVQLGKERDTLQAKAKELEAKVAELEGKLAELTPKDPVDIKGTPP